MEETKELETTSSVKISEDAIAAVAALAATDIEGVASMAGNLTNELIARLGIQNTSKGVKIILGDQCLEIELSLNVEYGCCIPEVCSRVREKVQSQVESMTGLKVNEVNIHIAGVNMDSE